MGAIMKNTDMLENIRGAWKQQVAQEKAAKKKTFRGLLQKHKENIAVRGKLAKQLAVSARLSQMYDNRGFVRPATAKEHEAAITIQCIYRGYVARCIAQKLIMEKRAYFNE